jgi:threonine/homoserine/homoserine lactone efflux protein
MQATASGPAGAGERFARAFSVSATNPKSILFLAALFPSFVDPRQPVAGQFAGLFAVIAVVVMTVHGSIAVAASAVSRLLGGERFSYLVRLASGCAFMGFGAAVVFTAWRGAG